jgi:Phage endonuclease I
MQLRIENLDVELIRKTAEWISELQKYSYSRYTSPLSKRKEWAINNPLSEDCLNYLKLLYKDGYGLKVLAREIGTSYSILRNLFQEYWEIPINMGTDISYERTKQFRSKKAKEDPNNPFKNWLSTQKRTKTNHGVQGYYINKYGDKLWLRSTYEYIYCKWLDKNDILYKYEDVTFSLKNGEKYRPDFILPDGTIIEVKGNFYTNRRYKADMLKEQYPDIKIIVVDNIDQYTEKGYGEELKEWKQNRLLS